MIRIICPTCNRRLMTIEAEGGVPVSVTLEGIVNIRCPSCMAWENVIEQFEPFRPPPAAEPPEKK